MSTATRNNGRLSRRDFLRLSSLAGAGAALAACAQPPAAPAPVEATKAPAPAAPKPAEQKPATIRFWHHWGGNRVPLMEDMIKRFQAKNPWITVEMTLQPWEQRLEKILTGVAAGNPPDVTMLGRQDLPAFVEDNALMALDDFMKQDSVGLDLFYPAEARGSQYNGKTYILPLPTGGALNILWTNKAWLKQAGLDPNKVPTTWAELTEVSQKLTVKDGKKLKKVGVNVTAVQGGIGWFVVWLYTNGGKYVSDDLKKITINTAEGLETMKWVADYVKNVTVGVEEVRAFYSQTGEWQNGPFYNLFEAMMINGSWEFFKIKDFAPDMVPNLGVSLIPHGPKGKSQGAAYGGWGYVVPRGVKETRAAWLLTRWLCVDKEAACWFMQEQKRPSPLKSCNEDPKTAEGNPYFKNITDIMAQDIWIPITPVQPKIEQTMVQMQEEVLFGRKTPEEGLKWGEAECQKLLDEYWAKKKA